MPARIAVRRKSLRLALTSCAASLASLPPFILMRRFYSRRERTEYSAEAAASARVDKRQKAALFERSQNQFDRPVQRLPAVDHQVGELCRRTYIFLRHRPHRLRVVRGNALLRAPPFAGIPSQSALVADLIRRIHVHAEIVERAQALVMQSEDAVD